MSSKARGLNRYAVKYFVRDNLNVTRLFADGDVNTSLIMTEDGVTGTLNHDTQLPRPYSDSGDTKIPLMVQRLQGTDGIFFGRLEKIYIDGCSPEHNGKIRQLTTTSTTTFSGILRARPQRHQAVEAKTASRCNSSSARCGTGCPLLWTSTMLRRGA